MKNVRCIMAAIFIIAAFAACSKKGSPINPNNPTTPGENTAPRVTFKTNRNISNGGAIYLGISANQNDKADVWIDINNNKTKDPGEQNTNFFEEYNTSDQFGSPNYFGYKLDTAQTITIYGKITGLYIEAMELTQLDLSNISTLTSLYCRRNALTSLDVSKNPSLIRLYCDDNPLKSLNLSKNPALMSLSFSQDSLTSIDLSANAALQYFFCSQNLLESLDVTRNTALIYIACNANNIKHLDVSKNVALKSLNCAGNLISALNFNNNLSLTDLACANNLIRANEMAALFNSLPASGGGRAYFYNPDVNYLTGLPVDGNQIPYGSPSIEKAIGRKWQLYFTDGRML